MNIVLFGTAYLGVWVGFSVVATFLQWTLQREALLSDRLAATQPAVAATVLLAAGLYQFTPVKHACLTACRRPLDFLMTSWRDGAFGALMMGVRHGVFCLGCCWALMLVLFAVGVMNLSWVAALTALILVEKVIPGGIWLSRIAGLAITTAGIYLLVTPFR